MIATTFGKKPLKDGLRINGAHIDAPRLDLKRIRSMKRKISLILRPITTAASAKYQWGTMPLAIHGVVAKKTES